VSVCGFVHAVTESLGGGRDHEAAHVRDTCLNASNAHPHTHWSQTIRRMSKWFSVLNCPLQDSGPICLWYLSLFCTLISFFICLVPHLIVSSDLKTLHTFGRIIRHSELQSHSLRLIRTAFSSVMTPYIRLNVILMLLFEFSIYLSQVVQSKHRAVKYINIMMLH